MVITMRAVKIVKGIPAKVFRDSVHHCVAKGA
jgi:hypothetical protein